MTMQEIHNIQWVRAALSFLVQSLNQLTANFAEVMLYLGLSVKDGDQFPFFLGEKNRQLTLCNALAIYQEDSE